MQLLIKFQCQYSQIYKKILTLLWHYRRSQIAEEICNKNKVVNMMVTNFRICNKAILINTG